VSADVYVFKMSKSKFFASLGQHLPKIAEHIRSKRTMAAQVCKDAHFFSSEERKLVYDQQDNQQDDFVMPTIQGHNSSPFNSGEQCYISHAVLDTGANST